MTHAIEKLILREAQLLDAGKLDDWLALYTEDATYWLPIDETVDPLKESSIIFDNHIRLAMRVEQIMRQARVAQQPPSQTLRMISNVDVQESTDETATVNYALLMTEVRSGDWRQNGLGQTRFFPGHCTVKARNVNGDWKICQKTIVLLNRHQPIVGMSFII
ncbi:MAG: aromatic-ring-hydroxylating dioxygenase subunit beta [Alcaligenaceae bacterium]|nr:aromatic-ring-hydroxylating dioxygenase subunit beta [Alcaligenaceae bacterium]